MMNNLGVLSSTIGRTSIGVAAAVPSIWVDGSPWQAVATLWKACAEYCRAQVNWDASKLLTQKNMYPKLGHRMLTQKALGTT